MHQSTTTQTGVNIPAGASCGKPNKRGMTSTRIAKTKKKKTPNQKNKMSKKPKTKITKVKKTKNKTFFLFSWTQKN